MEIAAFTVDLLKQTVRAWQMNEPIPDVWHTSDALPPPRPVSPAELRHDLYEYLVRLAQQKLAQLRTAEGLSVAYTNAYPTRAETTAVFTADFSTPSTDLQAWSTLYHRALHQPALTAEEMSTAVSLTPRQINRYTNQGYSELAAELQRQEREAHQRQQTSHRQRHLPPATHHHLFGVKSLLAQIRQWAMDEAAFPMLSLEGIGGIGKTTAARAAAQELAAQANWADIFWVSAQQQDLDLQHGRVRPLANAPTLTTDIVNRLADQMGYAHLAGLSTAEKLQKLRPACQSNPYLIIIDNLETLADLDDLVPHLTPLAQPTRFLLTSRHALSHYGFVQAVPVPNLLYEDSYALVQSELARRPRDFQLAPAAMKRIYDLVGGLPLALKLLAAQLGKLPLEELLHQLVHSSRMEMYSFIYRRSWASLSEEARQLLVSLHDVSADGADLAWIEFMADLSPDAFAPALAQLIDYSLLETDGNVHQPLYRLHRLTTTFLRSEIIDSWEGVDREK